MSTRQHRRALYLLQTDSNSGITAQEAQQLGVALLPMPIQIDGQMYLEGIDLFPSEFYARLAQGADVSTSQPSPADTMELWDKLLEEYDQLVYIPMTSGLSGSCAAAAALAVARDIPRIALAPRLDLFCVPSSFIMMLSMWHWSRPL